METKDEVSSGDLERNEAVTSIVSTVPPRSSTNIDDSPNIERTESTYKIVPRADRSGLLSSWTIVPEITDPKQYSARTKNFLVFVVACAATSGPMSCGIMFPALRGIEEDLQCSATTSNLSVSVFLLGMGVSPLWLAYISEHFGRRTVYLVTFTLYCLFTVLTGFATSIAALLSFRVLAALSSGSAQALGAGTIADIYVVQERGHAISWFYLGPLVAPLVAPIFGGLVTAAGTWRNTQWFLAALGAFATLLLVFCLPETLHDLKTLRVTDAVTKRERDPTKGEVVWRTLLDPLKTFVFFKYPAVSCSVLFAALNFGGLYVLNISVEYGFSKSPYNFSTIIIGCLYLGNSTGYILGSIVGGRWCDTVLKQAQVKSGKEEFVPEKRIGVNAWTGAALAPLGIILYGWTIDRGLFWFVPLIGTFFFGLGTMFIYSAVTTYLIDVLPGRSSSAMALNNFVRCTFACIGSVVAVPAIDALGDGILFSIIGGLFILSTLLVLAIVLKGDSWRERTRRASVVS